MNAGKKTLVLIHGHGVDASIWEDICAVLATEYPAHEVQPLMERFRHLPPNALAAEMNAMADRPNRTQVLRDAAFPVLLMSGKQDQLMPYEK